MAAKVDIVGTTISAPQMSEFFRLVALPESFVNGASFQLYLEHRDPFPQQGTSAAASKAEPVKKFALLADLGIITVPNNYDHATWLKTFAKKNRKKFYYYNDSINDENFSNPSRVLKPGEKLHVRVFKQVVSGMTTSEERMAFLSTQKTVLTGAQGASLVFEQKRDQLPKGYWHSSFDEKDCLWQDAGGCRRVPGVGAGSGGDFEFSLGFFEEVWLDGDTLLCFCDVE